MFILDEFLFIFLPKTSHKFAHIWTTQWSRSPYQLLEWLKITNNGYIFGISIANNANVMPSYHLQSPCHSRMSSSIHNIKNIYFLAFDNLLFLYSITSSIALFYKQFTYILFQLSWNCQFYILPFTSNSLTSLLVTFL